ncbi:MAG: hypothetical protein M3Z31_13780, partial [Pseudomonadota bacterium]|nr:hypothetical protein [Pseudomonadota bacterium]
TAVTGLHRRLWRDVAAIALLLCLLLVALRFAVGAQAFDFSSPFSYSRDGLSHGVLVKSLMEEGWFPAYNHHLGAPFAAAQFDYPGTDALHYIVLKLLALFTHDWNIVQNAYVLLGFALCGLAAYVVLRSLMLERTLAIAGALLYALLPFHMLRLEHIFLAAYFTAPIGLWLALEIWNWRERSQHATRSGYLLPIAAAVLIGASGAYYAIFATLIILVAGAAAVFEKRTVRSLGHALAIGAVILTTVFLTTLPTQWYSQREGLNLEVGQRGAAESELYGLTLAELVFPRPGHRVADARKFIARYHAASASNFERETVALGIVGTAGLVLAGLIVLRRFAGHAGQRGVIEQLALLSFVCFFIGTVGGWGSIIAWTISPVIRGYARVGVFIGFCALAIVMMCLQKCMVRLNTHGRTTLTTLVVAAVIVSIGVLDQTSPTDFARPVESAQFVSDRAFVQAAEKMLAPGVAIYQLPYHPYPEVGPVNGMSDYDLFRGYLHSTNLRWSHGNMKGRSEDLWQRELSKRSLDAQLDVARESGFAAVYVERRAFEGHAARLESTLAGLAGPPILVSSDGNLAMYSLSSLRVAELAGTGDIPAATQPFDMGLADLPQVVLSGFGGGEGWGRWTIGRYARIVFFRPLPRHFALEFEVVNAMRPSVDAELSVEVADTVRVFRVRQIPTVVHLEFESDHQHHMIKVSIPKPSSPASLGLTPNDDRLLGIGIKTLRVIALPPGGARQNSDARSARTPGVKQS